MRPISLTHAGEVWQTEVSSPLEAWHSFNHPYRQQIVEVIEQHLPYRGSVMEVGCGPGINLFRLHLARPDAILYGVDINEPLAGWAKRLLRDAAMIYAGNVLDFPPSNLIHVLFSVYTAAYFLPSQLSDYLTWARGVTEAVIFVEPTDTAPTPNDELHPIVYAAKPTPIFMHPYPELLRRDGWHVRVIPVPDDPLLHKINVITVGTRAES